MKSHAKLIGLACVLGLSLLFIGCSSDSTSATADTLSFTFGSDSEETMSGGTASDNCVYGTFNTSTIGLQILAQRNIGLSNEETVQLFIFGFDTGPYTVSSGGGIGSAAVSATLDADDWSGDSGTVTMDDYGSVGELLTGSFDGTINNGAGSVDFVGDFSVTREENDFSTSTDSACS